MRAARLILQQAAQVRGRMDGGRIARAITSSSARPRTQRSGNGTRRSTASASSVCTRTSSAPTVSRNGSSPDTPASALRTGPLKSTLVVPRACGAGRRPSGCTSSRAYTPQSAEKLSNRSDAPSLVTIGSAARRIAATRLGGVWKRLRATRATVSRPAATIGGRSIRPSKKYG